MAALLVSCGLLGVACQGPDEYFRGPLDAGGFDGPPTAGHGGAASGVGGNVTGVGGGPTGLGGSTTGSAGAIGTAGTSGTAGSGGSATGAAGTTGAGGTSSSRGGTTGTAGTSASRGGTTGSAGTTGAGGAAGSSTSRGGTTGSAGSSAGTSGSRGGTTGTGGTGTGTVLFSDDFENESVGATIASGWTRMGGSSDDWTIATDGTKVLQQDKATSSTIRMQSATGASGSPWSGAVSVSARVKMIEAGNSAQAALLCVRYNDTSNRYCVALVPNGVQILTAVGGSAGQSAVFTGGVTTGTFYDLRLSVDASNLLTVYLGGTMRGTYMPAAMTNGTVAVGTTSMLAAFDNISVTRP